MRSRCPALLLQRASFIAGGSLRCIMQNYGTQGTVLCVVFHSLFFSVREGRSHPGWCFSLDNWLILPETRGNQHFTGNTENRPLCLPLCLPNILELPKKQAKAPVRFLVAYPTALVVVLSSPINNLNIREQHNARQIQIAKFKRLLVYHIVD